MSLTDHWLGIDLDAWTRHVVRRHFNPELGSPYWLKRATELPFDPLSVNTYDDLVKFGPFRLGDLRGSDPAELVPRAVPRPLAGRIWESGGTTGDPVRVFYTEDMMTHRTEWRRWSFVADGFLPGRSWLQATPSGPHQIGNGALEISQLLAGLVYGIDMDPRWIKRLIRDGRLAELQVYTVHILAQMTDILNSQRIHYLNTTPALLRALINESPQLVARLDGVRLGGTHMSPEMYREFVEALDGGIVRSGYGNTFGNAVSLPPENDGEVLPYVPTYPQVTMSVVDPADWTSVVAPGKSGQLRLTVLHEDLLLPNILERDEATRYDTGGRWPVDGVANVKPLQVSKAAPEGLY
ncbi:hypothetical protein [Actinocrispum wychmicini]|uniref:AMP-binding enzyme n=1 Tax=Actinocrispum wychmicini TaxID=1213861 RepID=A0A4R2K0S9_9PSEU|nr:hypothetical protein [Actinocrispum wychmicini]TCO59915.1 AMP-binding enzyme [Actinocrispum wychmicini]